jgi:gliding motility-associated-like protein
VLANNLTDDSWYNITANPVDVIYTIVPLNGTCAGTPFTVTITVNPAPDYNGAGMTRCSDEIVNYDIATLKNGLGVTATGYNITNINSNGLVASTGSPVTGLNFGSLVLSDDSWTNTTANPVTVEYTIVPVAGSCLDTPLMITVTITPEPVYSNTTVTRCSDETVNFNLSTLKNGSSVTATAFNIVSIATNGLTSSGGSPAVMTSVSATEIADDRWTNTTLSPVNVVYTIVPVNGGSCLGTPFTVTVAVNPEPVGAATTFIKCNEEQFSLNLITVMSAASVLPSTFNITVNSGGLTFSGTSASQGVSKNANELFDDRWLNTTSNPVDVTYDIIPISASNCAGTSFTLTFTINPKPTAPAVTTDAICSDGTFNFDLQTVVNNTLGGGNSVQSIFRYTVTSNNPAVSPAAARNTPSDAVINDVYENRSNTNAVVTYLVTPISDLGCEGSAFEVRLTVRPEPVGINVTDSDCITNLNYNIQANHINVIGGNSLASVFTYTVASSDVLAVAPGPDRGGKSSINISDNYVNTSGSDVTITYTITPFNAANPACSGTPFTYAIVISSRPVGDPSLETGVCSDVAFNIDPQDNINNAVISTFAWTVSYDLGLTGPISGSGSTITGTLTNNTVGVKNAYYEVTPTSGSCAGLSFTITQPINPEPVISATFTTPVCSDVASNILLAGIAGSSTPGNFDVTLVSRDADVTAAAGNAIMTVGSTINNVPATALQLDRYTNNHRTIGLVVEYLVKPRGAVPDGSCIGDDLNIVVEVLPEPVMNPGLANVSICSDVANGIELDSDGISITATNYFINSVQTQSTGTSIAPNTTVAHLTSPLGNIIADPSLVTGARSKGFIKTDKFTVTTADASNDNNTVVYNVTPRSGAGCYGDPFNVNLFVLPEPRFDPIAPPPVCSDATIDLQLIQRIPTSPLISQYNVTGITWQSGLLAGNSNIAIGTTLTADASGNFIDVNDVYTNASATSLTATYLIKPIAAAASGHSCEGDVVNAVVTIRPSPQVLLDLDKIVCNEAVNGIVIGTEVTSAPAQSFQIVRNALPAGLAPVVFTPGTVIVNGASTNTIAADKVLNSTNSPITATYTVRANTDPSGVGCYGPAEVISVVVEPQILVTLSPGNTNNAKPNICSTDDTQITLISPSSPSAGNVTFNFSAVGSASGISGMSPGSNLNENDNIEQALSNSSNNPIDVTYTVTPRANSAAGGNGCIGTPSTTIVKVEPKPKLTALPASRTICEGVPLGIDFTTSTVPSTGAASMFFQLTAVEDPNAIGAPANVSGFVTTYPTNYTAGTDVLNDVLVNSGMDQQSIRYMFTPSFTIPGATCSGDPVAVNVVVSPRPVMVPFTVEPKCSSETFSLDFSSSVTEADPGSTLATWTFAYSPSGDPDLTGASNGAGYELSQVVFNKNAEPATVTYSIKAKAFGCESNVISVPVQVYPIPKITGVPRSVNVCDDALMSVPLNSTASNTQYTWLVDDELQTDLSGASDQTTAVNGPLTYTVNNASTGLGNYTFEITPQIATTIPGKVCLGDPHTLIANIAPPLDGNINVRSTGTDQSFICQGTQEAIEISLEGLLFFDVSYRVGSTTVNLTRQSQRIAIPVNTATSAQYELLTIKDGYGCSRSINEFATVTVYPKPDASFNEGTVPPFIAGSAIVSYTNTSLPFNPTEFSYEWTFGDQSNPKEYSGNDGVIPVNYSLPGFKEVTLIATNKAANANGVECSDTFRKTIEIILPPLIAAFQVNPLAACFPVDLEVISNTSTGDTYKWQVIDQSGNIAATALAPKPIFRIVNPGKYDVFLETSSSITGQKAFSQVNGIEVFDNPIASLEARPTTLFIPDTELTTFNFSTGANFYAWDFADGTTSEDFEPTHFYTLEGTYDITLVAGYDHGDRDIDGDGLFDGNVICYDTATRKVIAKEGGLTKVPNAFTPSKDGPTGGVAGNGTFNDTFLPITKGVAREDGSFIMQIFDRWGTLIFESRNQRMGWDGYDRKGNLVPAGVYVYKLDLRLADGQRTTQIGDVTVIR